MEENYVWNRDTHFYIDIEQKKYGCRINRKEACKAKEIIKYFKTNRREQINAWKKEWKLSTEDFIQTLKEYLKESRNINKRTYKKMKIIYMKEVMNNGSSSFNNSANQVVEKAQV